MASCASLHNRCRTFRFSRRLRFEPLEQRRLLATLTVTDLSDAVVTGPGSAPGTLRQAIYDANSTPEADIIEFAANLSGAVNLSVIGDSHTTVGASALLISSPITIRGNSGGIIVARESIAGDMRLLRVTPAVHLTLESITLTGGVARGANGGPGEGGGAALGGAVYNQGTLLVIASTLSGNSAIGGNGGTGGSGGRGLGGALYNDGGNLTVQNSTLSANSVASGAGTGSTSSFGGSIYSMNGFLGIYNSTITNSSANSGRHLYLIGSGAGQTATAEIFSSILAQADVQLTQLDVNATTNLGGNLALTGANNLIRRHNVSSSLVASDEAPLLAGLANNGGPTATHELLSGSPAIDAGSNPLGLTTDQRGGTFARKVGVAADIGAFESQAAAGQELPGDYNRNQVVDSGDYVIWRKTMGSSVPQYDGADGNGNGSIDVGDYGIWRGNFGATLSAATASRTEVGSAATAVIAAPSSFVVLPVFTAVGRELTRRAVAPYENRAPLPPDVRDEALLAALAEQASPVDSRGTMPVSMEFPSPGARVREISLASLDAAINPAFRQTGPLAGASTCRA